MYKMKRSGEDFNDKDEMLVSGEVDFECLSGSPGGF